MSRRLLSLAIVLLMVSSALAVLASSGWTPQGNTESKEVYKAHILTGATYNWYGNSSALASLAANWAPATGPPGAGDNIIFGATTTACTLNSAVTYGTMTMGTGSPTVTLGANVGVSSFTMTAGTFTGSTSYVLTDSGDFAQTAGTLTSNVLRLKMTGDGTSVIATTSYIFGLQVSANVTLSSLNLWTFYSGATYVIVDTGKTLTIATSDTLLIIPTSTSTFTNNGIITGAGVFEVKTYQSDNTITFGIINCPVLIQKGPDSTANRIVTIGSSTMFGSTLTISSAHATYTQTLDLSASNHALSCTDLTVGTRGILNARGSAITCSGSWDSSAGVFTKGTSTVTFTGAGKTLKTNTYGFFNLIFAYGSSTTLQSHVWGLAIGFDGTLTQAGYLMNVSGSASNALTATGSWNGDIYINGTGTSYSIPVIVPFSSSARIFSKVATTYVNTTMGSVTVTPAVASYGGMTFRTINKAYVVGANWSYTFPSGTATFETTLSVHTLYQLYVNAAQVARPVLSGPTGNCFWNYSVTGSSYFTVMQEGFLFTSSPGTPSVYQNHSYNYAATTNITADNWTFSSTGAFLSFEAVNHTVYGYSNNLNAGRVYTVNLRACLSNVTIYQNYSLSVLNIQPVFTKTPNTTAFFENRQYWFNYSTNENAYGATYTLTTDFTGFYIFANGTLELTGQQGIYWFTITVNDNSGTANATNTQSFTLVILPASTNTQYTFWLSIIFCFAFLFLGMKNPIFLIIAGISWLFASMMVFAPYGSWIEALGLGIGAFAMIDGGFRQWS